MFRAAVLALLLFAVTALTLSLRMGHEQSVREIAGILHKENYFDKLLSLLNKIRFILLQGMLFAVIAGSALLLLKSRQIAEFLAKALKVIARDLKVILTQSFRSANFLVFMIPFMASLYFAYELPISYDEACTWLYFTSKSPFVSVSYYPSPNNHILHSLVTNVTALIPFSDPKISLRFSPVFVSLFSWIILQHMITRFYTKKLSWLITALCSTFFMSVYYSYMSRGYSLLLLFFIIALYCVFLILKNGPRKKYWLSFSLACLLGFYTMPSFLYPFLTLCVFILIINKKLFRPLAFSAAATVVVTAILYLPVILVNGLSALTSNTHVKPIARAEVIQRLPEFLRSTLNEITGFGRWIALVALIAGIVWMAQRKDKFHLIFFVLFFAAPFLLLVLHSVIPFPRTFYYYVPLLVLCALYPLTKQLEKIPVAAILSIAMLLQLTLVYNFQTKIVSYEHRSFVAASVNKRIEGNNSYYINSGLFDAFVLYDHESRKVAIRKLHCIFPPAALNADTIQGWDFVICDSLLDRTQVRGKLIQTDFVNVYKE